MQHLRGSTRQIWDTSVADGTVHHLRTPTVGDLAFFDNTYDRNRNGLLDDDLTHIAVVIGVEGDGTILMAHDGSTSGRSVIRMNLHRRTVGIESSRRLNDVLRRADPRNPRRPTLTGELWRGFATVQADAVAMAE